MSESVDILVANQNTLPWLKLLITQFHRLKPAINTNFFVCDNASKDGSSEYLRSSGITTLNHPSNRSHFDSLIDLFKISSATYVAYLDVDAFPIKTGWLDEAIHCIKDDKVGAAGLRMHLPYSPSRRPFVHPSFCVFRRALYNELKLDPSPNTLDVGESMCATLEDKGYVLKFLGKSNVLEEDSIDRYGNKVFHANSSCMMLQAEDYLEGCIQSLRILHRTWLLRLGVWGDFVSYLIESQELNPLCKRYLQ